MPIHVNNFMGRLGWTLRKRMPRLSSALYLKLQFLTRGGGQRAYTEWFLAQTPAPQPNVVNIETINRCNSTCAFCTANVNAEKRPLRRIDEGLYRSIIDQLADWGYRGHLTLYGNNEPWLDRRIVEFHRYAREKLPDSFIFMSTNGLLLDVAKVDAIKPYVNQLIINNYCTDMRLHPNVEEIRRHVLAHPDDYAGIDILVQMRYLGEVLTNRAGSAPNTGARSRPLRETCLLPFTDMWIMPNGRLGLCCCDNFETTDMADLSKTPLREAWESPALADARRRIAEGRQNYPFCRQCDFIDAGFRMQLVRAILRGDQEGAHRIGGEEKKLGS